MSNYPRISISQSYTVASAIAICCAALKRCDEMGNQGAYDQWDDWIEDFNDALPSGSGIDDGSTIDVCAIYHDKVVIDSSYHAMDENGFYCGWIDFTVEATWNALGLNVSVILDEGDRRAAEDEGVYTDGIAEMLQQEFYECLSEVIPPSENKVVAS